MSIGSSYEVFEHKIKGSTGKLFTALQIMI